MFSLHILATSVTKVQIFTDLLLYAYVGIHQVEKTGLWQLPIVSESTHDFFFKVLITCLPLFLLLFYPFIPLCHIKIRKLTPSRQLTACRYAVVFSGGGGRSIYRSRFDEPRCENKSINLHCCSSPTAWGKIQSPWVQSFSIIRWSKVTSWKFESRIEFGR